MTVESVYFKNMKPEDQDREIAKIGRELFSTPNGQIFLSIMLDDLGFTREAVNPTDEALRNFATYFLTKRLGLMKDSLAVTAALLNIQDRKGDQS